MNLSFKEKSLWLMVLSLAGAYAFYLARVLPSDAVDVAPQQVALFVGVIVVMVALQVAGHVAIAIADRGARTDERDELIALKGARAGGFVLAAAVFCALCAALLTRGNFVFTHLLLGGWVLAQLADYGAQLFLQRRGA